MADPIPEAGVTIYFNSYQFGLTSADAVLTICLDAKTVLSLRCSHPVLKRFTTSLSEGLAAFERHCGEVPDQDQIALALEHQHGPYGQQKSENN